MTKYRIEKHDDESYEEGNFNNLKEAHKFLMKKSPFQTIWDQMEFIHNSTVKHLQEKKSKSEREDKILEEWDKRGWYYAVQLGHSLGFDDDDLLALRKKYKVRKLKFTEDGEALTMEEIGNRAKEIWEQESWKKAEAFLKKMGKTESEIENFKNHLEDKR